MACDKRTFYDEVKRQNISTDTYTVACRKEVWVGELTKQEDLKELTGETGQAQIFLPQKMQNETNIFINLAYTLVCI